MAFKGLFWKKLGRARDLKASVFKPSSMPETSGAAHIHEDDLELYLRGRLESDRISSIEPHLVECDTCRERLSFCLRHQELLHLFQRKSGYPHDRPEPRSSAQVEATLPEIHPLSPDRL
jgi:hypothetical protein